MNKNTFIISGVLVALGVLAVAQTGDPDLITGMLGHSMAKTSSGFILGFAALKLIVVALVSFLFSAIFWTTHKWVMKKK